MKVAAIFVPIVALAVAEATFHRSNDCFFSDDSFCRKKNIERYSNGTAKHGFVLNKDTSILDVLNPDILKNEGLLQEVQRRLRNHELVILRDAFLPEFADYVWEDLNRDDLEWEKSKEISPDGFSLSHSNFYWNETWSNVMFETHAVFDHPDTLAWVVNLTGRVTNGRPHYGAPSRFFQGDFSMPHSDYAQERSVSYVWHLSRDWNPSWGGAFYWMGERENHHAYVHASYNTLVLFSVTRLSQHMVTMVTSRAPEPQYKRLAWNGWWLDVNEYDYNDPVEDIFDTYDKRLHMTDQQVYLLVEEHEPENQVKDTERVQKLEVWRNTLLHEIQGDSRKNSFMVDLYGSAEKDRERWAQQVDSEMEFFEYDEEDMGDYWDYDYTGEENGEGIMYNTFQ